MVERLLSLGANVNKPDAGKMTALMVAAAHGHSEVVTKLLSAGADPHLTDSQGYTARSWLESKNYGKRENTAEIVRILQQAEIAPPLRH
jgi:ankyrin repeat protein